MCKDDVDDEEMDRHRKIVNQSSPHSLGGGGGGIFEGENMIKTIVRTVGGTYKYAVAILEEEVNLVIRVMWASKVSLRDHTMNVLIDTFYNTLNSVF